MSAEKKANYVRVLSQTEYPFSSTEQRKRTYDNFVEDLLPTWLPEGQAIPLSRVEPHDIIHFPHTGSLITSASGSTATDVSTVHQALVLGEDFYTTPPGESELSPEDKIPFVYHNKATTDAALLERISSNAKQFLYYGDNTDWDKKVEQYLTEQCPMPLLWLTSAVTDAMYRFDERMGGKILDANGCVLPEFADTVFLIHADSGAGEILAHHDRNQGRMHTFTLTDSLVNEPSGFIARVLGIHNTDTYVGACAASGKAIARMEEKASSAKNKANIFVVMSSYGGPTVETREVFSHAGITMSDKLPYLHNRKRGYTEAPAAVASIFVTKRFAEQQQLPIQDARLIRAVTYQGQNVFGVDEKIPEETYREGCTILQEYYPKEYAGTMVFATHGVNTMGWVYELDALMKVKREFFPNAVFVVTSTQPQLGHSYAPRSSISLETLVESAEEGVLFGMARATEDLTLVRQEGIQLLRRIHTEQLTNTKVRRRPWKFDGESSREDEKSLVRVQKLLRKLRSEKILLSFGSMKIPQQVPLITVHTGLGAESAFVCALPLTNND